MECSLEAGSLIEVATRSAARDPRSKPAQRMNSLRELPLSHDVQNSKSIENCSCLEMPALLAVANAARGVLSVP